MTGINLKVTEADRFHRSRMRAFVARLKGIVPDGDGFLDRLFDHFGDVLWLRLPRPFEIVSGVSRVALTRDPALIKPVFTQPHEAIDSTTANRMAQVLYGDRSLFLLDGPEHRRLRKLLLAPLHGASLRQWADVIIASTERASCTWPAQQSVRIQPRMLDVSLEVILKVALSIPDEQLPIWKAHWHELIDTWESEEMATRYALRRFGAVRRFRRLRRAMGGCDELVFAEIARRRAMPDSGQTDLLGLLIRAEGGLLTDETLRDQIFTMLVSGRSTTATTTSWAIERLLRTPSAMKKATDEARNTNATAYLEAVIHETLRVRPPILGVARVTRQPLTLDDYHFPANTLIYALLRPIHRKPELYENPDGFMPERFLQSPPSVHRFMPFGGGPHRCLGNRFAIFESALMLRTILRTVDLVAVDPRGERIKRKAAVYVPGSGALACASRIAAIAAT